MRTKGATEEEDKARDRRGDEFLMREKRRERLARRVTGGRRRDDRMDRRTDLDVRREREGKGWANGRSDRRTSRETRRGRLRIVILSRSARE